MADSTYNLVSLANGTAGLVGPKAVNLARMARMGLPVPPAGVIATPAYHEHVAAPGPAEALLAALAHRDAESLAALRRSMVDEPLSSDLTRQLHRLYDALGGGAMAVRSSAVAEDLAERSFAGQHGTYFRGDVDGCLRAVKECWASLWSESAFAYREHAGIPHAGAGMAVLFQPLVAAECAGVAFTADPLTGADDRVVVESCFGLGEALVSGKVNPDRFVFSLPDLKLVERSIGRKEMEILTGFDGRVYQWVTTPDRAATPSLSDRSARELARLSLAVAEGFGHPVDVEWAMEDGRIYLLQARPITVRGGINPDPRRTLPEPVPGTPETVWSNMNTGEVLPGVVTPATYSLIVKVGDIITDSLFGRLGVRFHDEPLFGRFAGRVYFNASAIATGFAAIPAFSRPDVNKLLGGMQERGDWPVAMRRAVEARAGLGGTLRFLFGLPGFLAWSFAHGSAKAPTFAARLRRETRSLLPSEPEAATEAELLENLQTLITSLDHLSDVLAFAGVAIANFSNLQTLCRRWFPDEGPTLANRLVTGLGDLDSAHTALDLWALARLANSQETLRTALLDAPPATDPRGLAAALGSSGAAFADAWDAFLEEHGHHARGEIELYTVRWSEDPGYLHTLLVNYLRADPDVDQTARQNDNARLRLALTADLRARLRDPVRRRLFGYVLRQAQLGSSARENLKSEAVRRIAAMRTVMLALGRRLVERGQLIAADDIFFLALGEIVDEPPTAEATYLETWSPLTGKDRDPTLRVLVEQRRTEYERDRLVEPPAVFVGHLSARDLEPVTPGDYELPVGVLRGLAVSSGVVEGRARVIPTVDAVDMVLPGEVLVTPFTDPGWAPFLLPAAGIVMNMGGLLSHGSIIAREYGIPAVVNVGPATSIIKTGRRVRVDGDRGIVTLLD